MPIRDRRESPLSEAARDLKLSTRLMAVLAGILALAAIAAFKGWILPAFGPPFVSLFIACALISAWFGLKAHKRVLDDREKESGRAMIVAIAAQLGRQDDASLERIKAKGGPAGEAAGLILQGRAEKLKKRETKT
jgi:hypothetical protein